MSRFVHLHLHTQYSLLDGVNKIPGVLKQAHAMGQPAIAMTDHGNLHGAIEFYSAAKEIGIKPIIGCELYVTPGSRFERKTRAQGGAGTHHLTVLAQNIEGYKNLCKLISAAYKEGFYFKPRVDHELLSLYNKGLVALSGCLASELNSHVEVDDFKRSKDLVEYYLKTFGKNFYLEVQPHQIQEQQRLNSACFDFAKDMGVPVVATTDCHYSNIGDHFAQEVLMCISTGKTILDPDRIRHEGVKLHLKSEAEMLEEFSGVSGAEEAIRNSSLIAEGCDLKFDFSTYYMPKFETPKGKTLKEIMTERAVEGLERRLEAIRERKSSFSQADEQRYRDNLNQEIELIDKMGFAGYFLVVADFIVWAKEQNIPVGPGRGSAAGSLVAYAMRITEVDPIEHKLLFERFLNPERVSLPDIDVDFCIYGRDKVIEYVVKKYGADRVAQIATFGTLKAKAAIKDVGRALAKSYAEMDRVAQLVPAPRQGFDFSLEEALTMEPKLKEYAQGEGCEVIDLAMVLEGLTRHASTHAAGVVIGDRPLDELLPMMVDKEGHDVTQYSMKYVEKIGLVKFDFLGLKTMTVIHTALNIIRDSRGVTIDFEKLPLDDAKTYSLLCAGNTTGVFQLESTGITEMTVRLKPNCFDDLVAILALFRPGPLDSGMVDHYIDRKHGREPVVYLHPKMKDTLADTYGIMLYQEQIMQLARELAGYSLGGADLLRRAMGKKNPEEMAKQRQKFIDGCKANGIADSVANKIFDQMETFARYGFNRSHSAAYAMISYQTAYLKSHYPVEFMAALMSHEMEDSDKTLKNMNDCRELKIKVLPPDLNISSGEFSVSDNCIRFGLSALKGVGEKAVESILQSRKEDGPFKDLEDFLTRVDLHAVNKRVVESLIKCGAFDFAKESRRGMNDRLEDMLKAAQSLQKDENSSQISLFGGGDGGKPSLPKRNLKVPEWPINKKLAMEREALGLYISGHPLAKFERALKRMRTLATVELKSLQKGGEVKVGGVVTALRLKNTKKGDRYATFTLEDSYGTVEAIVWPDTYRQVAHLMAADDPVVVAGRADIGEERCSLIVDKMESLIALRDRNATQGLLTFSEDDSFEDQLDKLYAVFKRHVGACPIKVRVGLNSGGEHVVALRDEKDTAVMVMPSEALCEEIEQIFGEPVLTFI